MYDFFARVAKLIPHHGDVLVNLCLGGLVLLLSIYMDADTKILNCLSAGYTPYLLHLLLREDLGLLFVKSEVPLVLQGGDLDDDLFQLMLVVRHDQHVISKGQQVTSTS